MSETSGVWVSSCRLCRIMAAVEGQTMDIAVLLLKVASKVRCRCRCRRRHPAMWLHPHTAPGCKGFDDGPLDTGREGEE